MSDEPLTEAGFWARLRAAGVTPNPKELANEVVTCSTKEGPWMIENPRRLNPLERRQLLNRLLRRIDPFGH